MAGAARSARELAELFACSCPKRARVAQLGAKLSEIALRARRALPARGRSVAEDSEAAAPRACRARGGATKPRCRGPDALPAERRPTRRPEPSAFKTARRRAASSHGAGRRGGRHQGRAGPTDAVRDLCADAGEPPQQAPAAPANRPQAGATKARRGRLRRRRSTTRTTRRSRRGSRSASRLRCVSREQTETRRLSGADSKENDEPILDSPEERRLAARRSSAQRPRRWARAACWATTRLFRRRVVLAAWSDDEPNNAEDETVGAGAEAETRRAR